MEPSYEASEVLVVAKKQRNLLIAFFVYLMAIFAKVGLAKSGAGGSEYDSIIQLAIISLGLAVVIFCAILAFKVYGKLAAILLTILCIIPLVNLIAFLVVNSRTNKIIKSHGFRVGLAGADINEIARSIEQPG